MVAQYHRGSIVRALLDLFPDIGLNKSKFWNKCMLVFLQISFSPANPFSFLLSSPLLSSLFF